MEQLKILEKTSKILIFLIIINLIVFITRGTLLSIVAVASCTFSYFFVKRTISKLKVMEQHSEYCKEQIDKLKEN